MYLQAISHAVPKSSFTQKDCWDILTKSPEFEQLKPRSQTLLEKILKGDTGIHKRHFATEQVDRLFSLSAEELSHDFEHNAPALATKALTDALDSAGIKANELNALLICTCTGYLCPGLTSYVAESLGLNSNTYLQDIVGHGCGAAIPTLRSAQGILAANPDATIACIAVEVCSAAFYLDDDPGVLISACLFGDAASATIWSNNPRKTEYRISNLDTRHKPEARELLRFTNEAGKLRNKLDRTVPQVAAPIVRELYEAAQISGPHRIAAHVGGRDVLLALENELDIPKLEESWQILNDYGNTSSPSVLIATEAIINSNQPADTIWLTSFGAGFAAHSCKLVKD
ncbi:MAG: type III polyketide synthase [Opitutaceae bacterium]